MVKSDENTRTSHSANDCMTSSLNLIKPKVSHWETDLEREHELNIYDRLPITVQAGSPNKHLSESPSSTKGMSALSLKSPSVFRQKMPSHQPLKNRNFPEKSQTSHFYESSPMRKSQYREKINSSPRNGTSPGSSTSFEVSSPRTPASSQKRTRESYDNIRSREKMARKDFKRHSTGEGSTSTSRPSDFPRSEPSYGRYRKLFGNSPQNGNRDYSRGRRSVGNWNSTQSPVNTSNNFVRGCSPSKLTEFFKEISKEINMSSHPFIDTHCHIDFMMRTLRYEKSFSEFMLECKDSVPFPDNFEGCVAVFCEPKTFKKTNWWKNILRHPQVWGSFGCHPHHANNFGPEEEAQLVECMKHSKVMAIGEMGLDYSGKNFVQDVVQKDVFRRQLAIAKKFRTSIVIHCRDAHKDCLQILKEEMSRDQVIHRHCYTGNSVEASELMRAFPNLYFGFTCLLTKTERRLEPLREAVRRIPLNRILLETDAPYFRPEKIDSKIRIAHPGMAIFVAKEISILKNVSLSEVLKVTRKNSRSVYGI